MQGEYTTTIILGEVLRVHLHEGVVSQTPSGHTVVDPQKLQPVCRLGGSTCAPLEVLGFFFLTFVHLCVTLRVLYYEGQHPCQHAWLWHAPLGVSFKHSSSIDVCFMRVNFHLRGCQQGGQ